MNIDHACRVLEHQEKLMANQLSPLGSVPAHVLERRARKGQQAALMPVIPGGGMPNHISIRDNRFTLISSDGERIAVPTLFLDCIIIGHNPNMSQMYYVHPFDGEAEGTPPDCWADNGVGPSTLAPAPQAPTCAVCEKKKWGSATSRLTGKGVPACQMSRKLAVFFGETIYMLKVTPGSFANFNSYCKYLAPQGAAQLGLEDVITRVSFERTGILKFEPTPERGGPYVPPEAYEMMENVWKGQLYREVLGLDDKPIEPERPPEPATTPEPFTYGRASAEPSPDWQTRMYPEARPMEAAPAPAEATEPPKRARKAKGTGDGVEAPQEAPKASQAMSEKVSDAFGFKFGR
jgi:hypothetical protein